MASAKEIELVGEIQRLCIRINMQGKYAVFSEYSGHVQLFGVHMVHAPWSSTSPDVDGWTSNDRNIYLSTGYTLGYGEKMKGVIADKIKQLEKLKADLAKFLDVDADGVPV